MSSSRSLQVAGMILVVVLAGCASPLPDDSSALMPVSATPPPPPRDGLIPVGQRTPDFEGTDHAGQRVVLSELLKSQDVVLVFYPKDFIPVCTRKLCAIRDSWPDFQRRNAAVLGVNSESTSEHTKFAETYNFPSRSSAI